MHVYSINFFSAYFSLEAPLKISEKIINGIIDIITLCANDLDKNKTNSPAFMFYDCQLNLPIDSTTIFIDFLKTNLKYFHEFPEIFAPFGKNFVSRNIEILSNSSFLLKSRVSFDISLIKRAYIIYTISKYLNENSVVNFKITYKNLILESGYEKSNCKILITLEKPITFDKSTRFFTKKDNPIVSEFSIMDYDMYKCVIWEHYLEVRKFSEFVTIKKESKIFNIKIDNVVSTLN